MTEPSRSNRSGRALREFLHEESAGGIVLVAAVVVALVWANSPWKASYAELWHTDLSISLGSWTLELDLHDWINDGLMAIFFFVVGLEIKREVVQGELRDPRRAALPAIAALGGMVVPALIYLVINAGGPGSHAWGVPMATDIAMAVGVLALLGARIAPSLKLFLLALAIVDDIGAILVIALFYSDSIRLAPFLIAIGLVLLVGLIRLLGVQSVAPYLLLGAAVWVALIESGLHATLTGVILGFMAPTNPSRRGPDGEQVSVVVWLEHLLHPWTSFVIVPLFALANAGITLTSEKVADAASSRITIGIVVALVIGKTIGIAGFSWVAHRLRLGLLPDGATWSAIVGVAALGGIGFTVSLFVADLAFDDVVLVDQAKVGILFASVTAAIVGTLILIWATRNPVTADSPSVEQ